MKALILAMMMISGLQAQAGKKVYNDVFVDWSKNSLSQITLLVCDDHAADGVRLIVVGNYKTNDFSVRLSEADIRDWQTRNIRQYNYKGKLVTEFIMEGGTSVIIKVRQSYKMSPERKEAEIEVADAC